jgi:hypothetical protein
MNIFPKTVDRPSPVSDVTTSRNDEETLVVDGRAALTPSQVVEQKLIDILSSSPLLVSQVQRRMKPGCR